MAPEASTAGFALPSNGRRTVRRRQLHLFLFFVLLPLLTCTDGPTAPGLHEVSLAVLPVFGVDSAPAAFNLLIDEVHVVIRRPGGGVAIDTTVAFPAEVDELEMEIRVQLQREEEEFELTLDLSADGVVLYSGTHSVQARPGQQSGSTPPIPVTFVGPGSGVTSLVVEPRDTVAPLGASVQYRVRAFEGESEVTTFYVTWSTGTAAAVIGPGGLLTAPLERGSTVVRARTPTGIEDETGITFAPAPVAVLPQAGDGAVAPAGSQVPITARVVAADELGVAGVSVTFVALDEGASVEVPVVVTDAQGDATTLAGIGVAAGDYRFTATVAGLEPAEFTVTSEGLPVSALLVESGDGQTGTAGSPVGEPLVVLVVDEGEEPAEGVTIEWTVEEGNGVPATSTSVSGESGLAETGFTLGTTAGTNRVRASVAGT
jgi:hypothetical protein